MIDADKEQEIDTGSAEDVRAAIAQLSKDDTVSSADAVTPSSANAEVPEAAQERARDASGKFTKVEQQAEQVAAPETTTTDADPKTEQPVQQSSAVTPPSFLSAEAKAIWAQTPSAIQAALIKRDADANEGGRQWSEQRQQIEQILSPLHQLAQQNGIPWQEGLNRLLNVESELRSPQTATEMVAQLIRAYPVDLQRLTGLLNGTQQPQPRPQPQFDPNTITQQVKQTIAAEFEDRALNSEIQNFGNARDANGQLSHPHFEAVKQAMGFLLSTGKAQSMQDAYDKAIWFDPEMRPQPQTQVNTSQQQVQKAKRAAVSVNGAPQNGQGTKANGFDANTSTRDDVREAMRMLQH